MLGCGTVPFDTLADLQQRYDLPSIPTALDYPDADAVVLLSTTDTELYFHGDASRSSLGDLAGLRTDQVVHRVIRVFGNLEERAVVGIVVSPGQRLVSFEAQIIDPAGARTVLSHADVNLGRVAAKTAMTDPDRSIGATAENILRFRFPDVRPGSILEYRYQVRRDSPYLYDSWSVQEYDPVLYTHYRLTVPRKIYGADGREWEWRFRRYRCARIEAPRVYDSLNDALGVTTEYLWTHRNISPFQPEPRMPPHQEYLQFVRFAHVDWKDWSAVTRWYYQDHLANVFLPNQDVTDQARALTRGLKTTEDQIDAVSRFVQLLEPMDLMLSEGTPDPRPPYKTLDRRRGDVQDKTVLLVAMLRALGFEADPALIVTSDRGTLDRRFPNWNFNHMLVVVNAEANPIWIDPTDRYRAFGDLPWQSEGVEAVVIGPQGEATVLKTPISRHHDNRTLSNTQIMIKADATAQIDVQVSFYGESAASAKEAIESRGVRQFTRKLIATGFTDGDLQSARSAQPTRGRLTLDFSFSTATFVDTEDVLARLRGNPIPFDTGIELMGEESRRYPLDSNFASTWVRHWTVDLSQSPFQIVAVPSPIEVENTTLLYRSRFSNSSPDQLESHQVLEIRKRRVLQLNYDAARLIAADMKHGGGRGVALQASR